MKIIFFPFLFSSLWQHPSPNPSPATPAQYYFTMPSYESAIGSAETTKQIHDLTQVENIKRYNSFWIKDVEVGGGTNYVFLSKGNKSPFIKLTKGEYLQALEVAIPGYYEKEENNHIPVTIKINDEKLHVFIDKIKIAELEKAIPAAHLFNALSFDCSGNSAENDKYYISNIKITKD